jgi:hypothetical protein
MVHGNFENYMKQVVVGKKNIFKIIISSLGGFATRKIGASITSKYIIKQIMVIVGRLKLRARLNQLN